jgi:hypothetical protein
MLLWFVKRRLRTRANQASTCTVSHVPSFTCVAGPMREALAALG